MIAKRQGVWNTDMHFLKELKDNMGYVPLNGIEILQKTIRVRKKAHHDIRRTVTRW